MSSQKTPLVTIITVSYNAVNTIEQTILSVINQNFDNYEYIIIDGGSTDGTIEIIKKYEHKIAYWVSESDKGIYDAMNKALNIVTGNWVLFLGADDLLFNNKVISDAVVFFTNNDIVYYGNVVMSMTGKHYDGQFSRFKLLNKNICQQSIFYPKSFYKNHRYNLKYKICSDYEYNLRLYAKKKFIFIPIVVSIFNETGVSSREEDIAFKKDHFKVIFKYYGVVAVTFLMLFKLARKSINIVTKLDVISNTRKY